MSDVSCWHRIGDVCDACRTHEESVAERIEEAEARGVAAERVRVVAWLRKLASWPFPTPTTIEECLGVAASDIERGEHEEET